MWSSGKGIRVLQGLMAGSGMCCGSGQGKARAGAGCGNLQISLSRSACVRREGCKPAIAVSHKDEKMGSFVMVLLSLCCVFKCVFNKG